MGLNPTYDIKSLLNLREQQLNNTSYPNRKSLHTSSIGRASVWKTEYEQTAFLTCTKLINNLLKIELESTQMKLLSN